MNKIILSTILALLLCAPSAHAAAKKKKRKVYYMPFTISYPFKNEICVTRVKSNRPNPRSFAGYACGEYIICLKIYGEYQCLVDDSKYYYH